MSASWTIVFLFVLFNLLLTLRQKRVEMSMAIRIPDSFSPHLGILFIGMPKVIWDGWRNSEPWFLSQMVLWLSSRVLFWGLSGFHLWGLIPVGVDVVALLIIGGVCFTGNLILGEMANEY